MGWNGHTIIQINARKYQLPPVVKLRLIVDLQIFLASSHFFRGTNKFDVIQSGLLFDQDSNQLSSYHFWFSEVH